MTSSSSKPLTKKGNAFGGCGGGDGGMTVPSTEVQFFVRTFTDGKTLVLRANFEHTIEIIHQMIEKITKIPGIEQRLIYKGKQLKWDQTLQHYGIQGDSCLQLLGRMRSTVLPNAWRIMSDMISIIVRVCKYELSADNYKVVKRKLEEFISLLEIKVKNVNIKKRKVNIDEYDDDKCKIFMDAGGVESLVMMYLSKMKINHDCGDECIRRFVDYCEEKVGFYGIKVVLEFRKLFLSMGARYDPLYLHCESSLKLMVQKTKVKYRFGCSRGRGGDGDGDGDGASGGGGLVEKEGVVKDLGVELEDNIGDWNIVEEFTDLKINDLGQ